MNYLILQHPGHNRVYYNAADKLALAELKLACLRLNTPCESCEIKDIEGIRYLTFSSKTELNENDLEIISRLSFVFALFSSEEKNGEIVLKPIKKINYQYIDEKISTLLKYQGKTNELFTRMMLNVALLSSKFPIGGQIDMLDPVAGKGTTLFEGAIYGFNSFGIEIEQKHVHETALFFKKHLENERIKHLAESKQVYGAKRADAVFSNEICYARTKEEFKNKASQKTISFVAGDAKDASKYFKKNRFHLIVGDLPYGIVHGNKGAKKGKSITRNPSELVNDCLPAWYDVLKPGGCIVLAWNSFLVSQHKMAKLFASHNFKVCQHEAYGEFEHMVDKSIKRDIIVATKQ
jgi:SAM-dependent methyltransferase